MPYQTLISPRDLAEHLESPDWVVFDCRHTLGDPGAGERAYNESHLPGARFAHLDRELSAPVRPGSGRHPLPAEEGFTNWLGEQGVSPKSQVVAYDASGGACAARLWWMLKCLGHEARAVLNGGLGRWRNERRPMDSAPPRIGRTEYRAGFDRSQIITMGELLRVYRDPEVMLIDARARERFLGHEEPIDPAAGHIPGAVNRPYADNLAPDGTFISEEQLRSRFREVASKPDPRQVIHYCGSGVNACHNILAMEAAGYETGRLYVGSWSQWCSDPSRPFDTGKKK